MTDLGSDGWNGNVFGFRQNSAIAATFGNNFTTGSSSGPLYITVAKNLNTQIVLATLGSKTNEVGFVVKTPKGVIVYSKVSGTTFTTSTYFTIFCLDSCPNTL